MDTSTSQPPEAGAGGKKRRPALIITLILLGLLAVLAVVYLLGYTQVIFVRPDWARQLGIPTITPMCARPTLTLGTASFPLEAMEPPGAGALQVPAGEPGTAWWVTNTFAPFVILLPRDAPAIRPGEAMIVQWADCGREEFVLQETRPEAVDTAALLAQGTSGMAVIVPGAVLWGVRAGQLVTPEPTDPNAMQSEVSFGETVISEDGKTLTTSLTILNTGGKPITVRLEDISLGVEGQPAASPLSVEPALPLEIQPGESAMLTMTFPNPGGNLATLKLLDFAVDLYY